MRCSREATDVHDAGTALQETGVGLPGGGDGAIGRATSREDLELDLGLVGGTNSLGLLGIQAKEVTISNEASRVLASGITIGVGHLSSQGGRRAVPALLLVLVASGLVTAIGIESSRGGSAGAAACRSWATPTLDLISVGAPCHGPVGTDLETNIPQGEDEGSVAPRALVGRGVHEGIDFGNNPVRADPELGGGEGEEEQES